MRQILGVARRFAPMLLAALALVPIACEEESAPMPTLTISANPTEIPADGRSKTLITAETTNVPDQTSIVWGTSLGSFDEEDASTTTEYGEIAGGQASIWLHAGAVSGTATITATLEEVLSDTTTVTFGGTPTPDPKNTSFTCQSVNIAGFTTSGAQMECTLSVKDSNGSPLPYDALVQLVSPKAEAGRFSGPLETSSEDYLDAGSVLHFEYSTTSGGLPVDVEPLDALQEPQRNKTGGVANPRDGLVTLAMVIMGSETCTGEIVAGECTGVFGDLPEPYIDVDDDGEYTGADLELVDMNSNGEADAGNGVWDAEWPFAKTVKVLWSGPPKTDNPPTTQLLPAHAQIEDCADAQFTVEILDANLNPPAANDGGGDMSISIDTATLKDGSTSVSLPLTMGMSLDSDGRVTAFQEMDDSYRYRFTITDSNCEGQDNEGPYEDGAVLIDIDGLYKGPSPEIGSSYSPDAFDTVQLTATLSVD